MDTSLELIRAKIAELEAKLANLHIAERELLKLKTAPAPRMEKVTAPEPEAKSKRKTRGRPAGRQTIGGAIVQVLGDHGALTVAGIAEQIMALGRDINRRAVSYSLQAMKKKGLVKSGDGKWMLPKARAKRDRA